MASVLVVDDNDEACRMMTALVRFCGHDGAYVTSGEAALTFVRSRPVALVILDNMMPGMDGIEVLLQIRGDPAIGSLPVVIWSAQQDPDFIGHAKRKGATDYWVKASFNYSALGERLDRVLKPVPAAPADL